MRKILGLLIFIFIVTGLYSQNSYTLRGYVKDYSSGETLIGANIYNSDNIQQGVSSNLYGFYSLTLPEGSYRIKISYLGYGDEIIEVDLHSNQTLNIEMKEGITIDEVVVTAKDENEEVTNTNLGVVELPIEDIKRLPVLMGEVDIMKTIQLMPGVVSAGEGSSGFFVRGGGADQNLVLLDEAVVYNTGHMFGFFSVFNGDAINNMNLIKGNMPANYGGRLSSVVDVQLKDGNNKKFAGTGGIGIVATRLTVEGPIIKNKSSFILSGRRTYIGDLAQGALKKGNFAGSNYFFYDFNAKLNYIISDKDRIYLSGYFGRDVFDFASKTNDFKINMPYGNQTATLRWNHLFSDRLFANTSLIYNAYDFEFSGQQSDISFVVGSGIKDISAKISFDYFPSYKHNIKFGVDFSNHELRPNLARLVVENVVYKNDLQIKYSNEYGAYLLDEFKYNNKLKFNIGLRFSAFSQIGPYTSEVSGLKFDKREVVKWYSGLEPRFSFRYSLPNNSSLKGGFSYGNQYLHLVSNSGSTLPTDAWVPSTEVVAPQKGIQFALGYFQNIKDNMFKTSVELYYKKLKNQIEYPEVYYDNNFIDVENSFVYGKGTAYGAEFLIRKNKGKLTGWIAYTLSKAIRNFDDIKNGESFPIKFDKTHDLAIVSNYQINKKWDASAVFILGTGNAYTPIKSLFIYDNNIYTRYGDRNSARLEPYHRLDLSINFTPKPNSTKRFTSVWNLSVYNVYNRKNTYFTYYNYEKDGQSVKAEAFKVSIFPIIPSITWNFKWK